MLRGDRDFAREADYAALVAQVYRGANALRRARLAEELAVLRPLPATRYAEAEELTGVSYKNYQQIESGRQRHMWFDTAERFARLYHLDLWQLLHPDFLKSAKAPRTRRQPGSS